MPLKFTKEQAKIIETLNKSNESDYGKWIDNYNGTITCSKCHTWFHKDDRYYYMRCCPYCGSKMELII